MRDMRPQLAFLKPAKQLLKRAAQQLRLVLLVGAPVEADDIDVFDEDDVGGNLGNAAGGKANNNDAAAPGNRAQAGVENVAAHGIIDDVSAAAAGYGLDALAQV